MALPLHPAEALAHSTVRITCNLANNQASFGTGFFYAFARDGKMQASCIVTNKHVVSSAVRGQFVLTLQAADGSPLVGSFTSIELDNFEQRWLPHPDPDVDLCVMPIGDLLNEATRIGKPFFYVPLGPEFVPSANVLGDLSSLEEILMIGYPSGIWDPVNNMPIFRRGITATHPNLDYAGLKEFLIDAACYGGSSGSPVFLFSTAGRIDRRGNMMNNGPKILLLGLLWGVHQYTVEGTMEVIEVPSHAGAALTTAVPMNLGCVIKAERILEMDPIVRQWVAEHGYA